MKTMKRFLALLLFFVAAMNVQTLYAQTNGDVNNDGSVNEADISAIIEIMKEANGVGPKKYYWYVGQENPASMTSISPIVDDNTSPGWRYIGNTKPTSSTFTSTNMLWNGVNNGIFFSRSISYIAIPYKPLQMWDADGGDGLFYTIQNNGNPININGVDYYIYMSDYKTGGFEMNIYNK
ncbi:MAG: hypothetical protein IKA00_06385 [Prevotella sp.]|nr:hypothetical protein [Prevotella sp.]